jgi:hypothetical protein
VHKIRTFHGHSTVGEWQGSGRVAAGEQHGNGMACVNRPLYTAMKFYLLITAFIFPLSQFSTIFSIHYTNIQ